MPSATTATELVTLRATVALAVDLALAAWSVVEAEAAATHALTLPETTVVVMTVTIVDARLITGAKAHVVIATKGGMIVATTIGVNNAVATMNAMIATSVVMIGAVVAIGEGA